MNKKGFSTLLIVVLIASVLLLGILYAGRLAKTAVTEELTTVRTNRVEVLREVPSEDTEMEELSEEPEGTPEELSNDEIEELDSLMTELESVDEDLGDLSL